MNNNHHEDTKKTLITACEKTVLAALHWANECFEENATLTKEETILLERIVLSAAELVRREHYEF